MMTTKAIELATPTKRIISPVQALWRSRLVAAFRIALACSIVGFVTLFGPLLLQQEVAFPALTYVIVILIVTEATLGDTVRGCWHAILATCQGVLPAILSLWLIGPARYSISASVLAVTITSFAITLPESTHLICKRIALGQIVILYSVTSMDGVHTEAFTHARHVAASTALGALASFLALVFPYPRLASFEVRNKGLLFKENFSQRLNLFVNAFCAENKASALASVSQAKSLAKTGSSLLQNIKIKQENMPWEKPLNRLAKQYDMCPAARLQALETPLKGIELALTSSASSFPLRVADQEVKILLSTLNEQISSTVKQTGCSLHSDSSTVPETKGDDQVVHNLFLQTLQPNILLTKNDLPSLFFLFCMKLLHDESMTSQSVDSPNKPKTEEPVQKQKSFMISNYFLRINSKRLIYAAKCSLSLGLAVLFGMIYNKENGFWAGLAVGVGMAGGREATFKIANIKAQGTVLGSIYGVLACFLFPKFLEIRFLSLIPWIIFTTFLKRSRMYDQAGAISATIAALIILGRKNYGSPTQFAFVRITEVFIGLSCSVIVDLLVQPIRASTMAKGGLSKSLRSLHKSIESIDFCTSAENKSRMCLKDLKENEKKLRANVTELGKLIAEAAVEPNFWFIPFHGACYSKLLGSLLRMADLLLYTTRAMESLVQESKRFEVQEQIGGDLDIFKRTVNSSLKCFEEITSIKSLQRLEKELTSKNISYDVEMGKCSLNGSGFKVLMSDNEEEMEKFTSTLVQHLREVVDKVDGLEGDDDDQEEEMKSQMILCLSALGFCIDGLMKETKEIGKSVKELVQWENPCSHVNLCEIYCKINALYS